MKPRRWYSSPEVNPTPESPMAQPYTSLIQLAYAARTHRQQGAIIKLTLVEPPQDTRGQDPQAPAANVIIRRIDAA
jgi:hypothetical protein